MGLLINELASLGVLLIVLFFMAFCLTYPLALVAETIEYDVLRALNTPTILRQAQNHIGQQMLPHLINLEWGFRFGGCVINTKIVMHIACALAITLLSTFTRALTDTVGV